MRKWWKVAEREVQRYDLQIHNYNDDPVQPAGIYAAGKYAAGGGERRDHERVKQMNDYDIFVDSIREAAALAERSAASAQASAEAAKAIAAQNRPAEGLTEREKELVLTLLRNAAYASSEMQTIYDRLKAAWKQ